MTRFIPPVAASVLVILWAPFIGEIRNWIKAAFPGQFVWLVGGAVASALAVAFAIALVRIRTSRLRRYGAVTAAFALMAAYMLAFRTGNGDVDAVELFHFVLYGLVTWLFYRAVRTAADASILILTLLYGVLVGTIDEWFQWLLPTRVGDAGDVFLNLYAVVCGLAFSLGMMPPDGLRWRLSPPSVRRVLGLSAVVVASFGAFFSSAHLGYEIRDPEIGRFRSFHTAEELAALGADRARAWANNPPRRLELLGREDFYLTEGGWHAQARNVAYARRDLVTAWKENRILETYYDPFLDLHSFGSGERHRWAPEQRREVEAGAGAASSAYVSGAMLDRIHTRPSKGTLGAVTTLLAVALAVLSRRGLRRRGGSG
jgi:hypothetical protein